MAPQKIQTGLQKKDGAAEDQTSPTELQKQAGHSSTPLGIDAVGAICNVTRDLHQLDCPSGVFVSCLATLQSAVC